MYSMSTRILNKKMELIRWLSALEDKSVIDKIMEIKKQESRDWWIEISEEERKSLERGIDDAEKGKLVPHSSVRKRYEKWL